MPAVALTDHGSLAGSVDLYKAARDQGIKPIVGCEVYVADDRHSRTRGYAHLTLLAESNAGYSNLIKLSSLGYLEGYYTKPRVDWELLETLLERPDRALRLPLRPRLQGARGEPAQGRRRRSRPAGAGVRARQHLRRAPERGPRRAAARQPGARQARGRGEAAARRHRRRPLPHRRGRLLARGAALHSVGGLAQEPESLEVRHERVLFQDPGRDGARLPRPRGRDAAHARGRRALLDRDRARQHPAAEVPDPERPRRLRLPRRALRPGARAPLRQGHAGAARAAPVRAEDDPRDGLRRLLPDRLGLHPLREGERDRRRPRPRLGRRLARRLRARDHRHRPDQVRPPLRAVPQPGPQVDARHRHRLRRRGPRAGDQLRLGEVRPRPRRPDHHLRDDGRPRRRPRRRPGARDPLRRRRPGREADPGRAGADARRVPQARLRPEDGLRDRPGREGDHRPGAGRSRGSSGRTRSTPPASSSAPSR